MLLACRSISSAISLLCQKLRAWGFYVNVLPAQNANIDFNEAECVPCCEPLVKQINEEINILRSRLIVRHSTFEDAYLQDLLFLLETHTCTDPHGRHLHLLPPGADQLTADGAICFNL
jgi:hypothetical protein